MDLHPNPRRAVVEGASLAGGGVAGHGASARVTIVVVLLDTNVGAAVPPARHVGRDRIREELL